MRGNPFLRFQRTAEASAYPALLVVSAVCLLMVVAAVALLALTPTAFAFAFAILNLIAAIGIMSGAIFAVIDDVEDPDAPEATRAALPGPTPVVPLATGRPRGAARQADRTAA